MYTCDDADRPPATKQKNNHDVPLLAATYEWNLDNTVQEREETEYDANGQLLHTAVVNFYYDARKRLIQEVRVVDQSVVYDLEYEYDPLGNRTRMLDNVTDRETRYAYDTNWNDDAWDTGLFYEHDGVLNPTDPYHDIGNPKYTTRNNRLIEYRVYDPEEISGQHPLLRTVVYHYFDTGHVSHILVKDEYQGTGEAPPQYDQWHGLEFVYTTAERLWLVLWVEIDGDWRNDVDGNPDDVTDAWEFRFDGSGRQRYLARQWEVDYPTYYDPEDYTPVTDPLCTDYLAELPYVDFTVDFSGGPPVDVEGIRYLPGFGVQAEQLMAEQGDPARYLHGDLIDSTMLTTDDNGALCGTGFQPVAYTAFGDVVLSDGTVGGELPAGYPRYAYAGGYGYETGLITLYGPNPDLPPITLQHVGQRWYQPGIGRFVQRDPIWIFGGLNVYGYCRHDPIGAIDPSGLGPKWTDGLPPGIVDWIGAAVLGGSGGGLGWGVGYAAAGGAGATATAGAGIGAGLGVWIWFGGKAVCVQAADLWNDLDELERSRNRNRRQRKAHPELFPPSPRRTPVPPPPCMTHVL